MDVVKTREDLAMSISQLALDLDSIDSVRSNYARVLIKRGICFVVTDRHGEPFFSPSRFVGYRDNTIATHEANMSRDGRITNPAISEILGLEPMSDKDLEEEYMRFCVRVGVVSQEKATFGHQRKFWDIRSES